MFWEREWDALEGYTVPRNGGSEGWGCLQHPPIWEVPGRGNCPEQGNLARDLASTQNVTQYLCLQCGCGPPHLLNASSGGNCPKISSQPILQHQEAGGTPQIRSSVVPPMQKQWPGKGHKPSKA